MFLCGRYFHCCVKLFTEFYVVLGVSSPSNTVRMPLHYLIAFFPLRLDSVRGSPGSFFFVDFMFSWGVQKRAEAANLVNRIIVLHIRSDALFTLYLQ